MRNNCHQVSRLPQSSVDFIPLDIHQLVDSAKSEATYSSKLVLGGNVKYFVDEVCLFQPFVEVVQVLDLVVNSPILI